MAGDNRRFPTWQWIVGVLLFMLFATVGTISAIAAYSYKDTRNEIAALKTTKADKDDFERMYGEMQGFMKEMREFKADMGKKMEDQSIMMSTHIAATQAGSIPERRRK